MTNPEAGPATNLLLRGEGKSENATSPAGAASFHRVAVLHSRANVCTLEAVMLAGRSVPEDDVRELARLVDEPTQGLLEKALELGTVVFALTIDDRMRVLWALDDPQTTSLAKLRATLLLEHEGRVRDGIA